MIHKGGEIGLRISTLISRTKLDWCWAEQTSYRDATFLLDCTCSELLGGRNTRLCMLRTLWREEHWTMHAQKSWEGGTLDYACSELFGGMNTGLCMLRTLWREEHWTMHAQKSWGGGTLKCACSGLVGGTNIGLFMLWTCRSRNCSLSLWRVVWGSKLMHLHLIHGLFIT